MLETSLRRHSWTLAMMAGLAGCAGSGVEEESDSSAAGAETRAQASGMTLWVNLGVERALDGSVPTLRLLGRTSKNLESVRLDGREGQVNVLSARRFEVVLRGSAQIGPFLAGAPLPLVIEASAGRIRDYQARLQLRPMLAGFSGDRRIWVSSEVVPSFVPGAGANLEFRARFSVPRGVDAASVSVTHPALEAPALSTENGLRFTLGLSSEALVDLVGEPGVPLVFQVGAGSRGYAKQAQLALAVEGLALTTADAPFPVDRCDEEVAACLAGAAAAADCGSYQQILHCQSPVVTACEPNLEWAISDCVYRLTEEFAADPDRGAISDLEALEFCTREGDLTGPMFDGICGTSPNTPFCACQGQETCFEAFDRDFVAPCAAVLQPRFDCAFGRSYQVLRNPRANIFVVERRVLALADVIDSLRSEQIVAAVRQSANNDVRTLAEAFERVDGNQVNLLDFWEGSNDLPYTAIEFGAGDNSYGAVFEYGSTNLAARIQDSDFYDASNPPNLGCHLPQGPGWRRCDSNEGCATGQRCEGILFDYDQDTGERLGLIAPGKCVAPAPESPRADGECSASNPCPLADNLWCSSIATGNNGFCRSLWMFGTFPFPAEMALPVRGTAQFPVVVAGLATVPEEAVFEATINSGNWARLRLSLANPIYRTTSTFFDGPALGAAGVRAMFGATAGEFRVRFPVGVPGDESVNGEWLLLIDTSQGSGSNASSATNVIYGEPTLSLSSRWD